MTLTNCTRITKKQLTESVDKHGVENPEEKISYSSIFAWHLAEPEKFTTPVPFMQKKGGRMWVNIDMPKLAQTVRDIRREATSAKCDEDIARCVEQAPFLGHYSSYKNPYFRVRYASASDFLRKFYYAKGSFDSMKQCLLRALDLLSLTESFRDEVECMQLAELRNTVAKNGLCKAGNHEDLKRKLLDHMLSKIGGSERKDQDAGEEAEKSEAAACPKAEKLDADGEQKRTQGSQKEQSEKKNSKEEYNHQEKASMQILCALPCLVHTVQHSTMIFYHYSMMVHLPGLL